VSLLRHSHPLPLHRVSWEGHGAIRLSRLILAAGGASDKRFGGVWTCEPRICDLPETRRGGLPAARFTVMLPRVDHRRPADRPAGGPLDDVSKKIIEQLQEDGRRPYGTIGKAVGLSESAVRQRVQRLLDTGVMQIVAVTDPLQVGFPRQALIGVRVDGETESVADALADIEEVDYVVMTAGSFDIMIEVVCEDDDHLLDLLSRRIRRIPGVRSTESFVYLRLRKQTYGWGTR
jgi:Lrp/AsnC family transcriptional regulator for asnA, asnC and gidA